MTATPTPGLELPTAMTALLLGGTVRPRPTGLALLQPQAIRLLDLVALQLHTQTAEATRQGRLTPDQQHTIDVAIDAAVTALREHRPVGITDLPPAVAQLFEAFQGTSSRFVDSDDAVYPPATTAALRPGTKVLLTCGTNDSQVPCATTDALTTALHRAHTAGPGRVPLPGVDHLLHGSGGVPLWVRIPMRAWENPVTCARCHRAEPWDS